MTADRYKTLFDEAIERKHPEILRPFEYGGGKAHVPEVLAYMWSRVGISIWLKGTFRTCDPDMVWPSIEDALEGKSLLNAADCVPYLITAFGSVYAWNRSLGAIEFDFQRGRITIRADPRAKDQEASPTKFVTPFLAEEDSYDDYDLYDEAVRKFGPLNEDQIFSFAPIFALGGQPKKGNLIMTNARAHLALLSQSQGFDILHFDRKRYPGGFERVE
ncbi:T6SS immunity protein Tdi1 domain-containing protein [Methylobacterium sp. Leaf112]|uniref:T6SS immunity protein Tdi1 domain-containing protein n=1 Tax=Methylobacterium sp. Leaf112 TaxID=1736258 RepID=UPI0009EB97CE|nr:T6SS immunity protein Tdi1 domain-containing protein [Methylobacterium sp. Leaf112]